LGAWGRRAIGSAGKITPLPLFSGVGMLVLSGFYLVPVAVPHDVLLPENMRFPA
jgi:hypothetical protein